MNKDITIFKAFNEEDNFRNVIIPLSLKVKRIVFFIRKEEKEKHHLKISSELLKNKINCEIIYIALDKNEKSQIKNAFEKYDNVALDISGSRYILLMLFEEAIARKIPIYYFDEQEYKIKNYVEHTSLENEISKLTITELLSLGGGKINKHIHLIPNMSDKETNVAICNIMEDAFGTYNSFLNTVASVGRYARNKDADSKKLETEEINKLKRNKFVQNFIRYGLISFSENNKIRFKNELIKNMFEVSGCWLESYLYLKCVQSKEFDDVMMSVIIDFSEGRKYPVTCEIDLLVIKDNRLAFVSCKSNKVDSHALNEITLYNKLFGNDLSQAMVVTVEEVTSRNKTLLAKANELDVWIIDQSDLMRGNVVNQMKRELFKDN